MVKKYRKLLGYIGPFRKRRFWLVVLCAASILIGSIMPGEFFLHLKNSIACCPFIV